VRVGPEAIRADAAGHQGRAQLPATWHHPFERQSGQPMETVLPCGCRASYVGPRRSCHRPGTGRKVQLRSHSSDRFIFRRIDSCGFTKVELGPGAELELDHKLLGSNGL